MPDLHVLIGGDLHYFHSLTNLPENSLPRTCLMLSSFLRPSFEFTFFPHGPGMLAYNFFQIVRKDAAALKIQTDWRWHKFNQNYSRLKKATITMQAIVRAMAARKQYDFTIQNKTATVIQVFELYALSAKV